MTIAADKCFRLLDDLQVRHLECKIYVIQSLGLRMRCNMYLRDDCRKCESGIVNTWCWGY